MRNHGMKRFVLLTLVALLPVMAVVALYLVRDPFHVVKPYRGKIYNPGDTIYTSGYSAIFPPDIPLGVAGEAKVINGATNEIRVKLFQDHSALKYVTIIENTRIKEIEEIENSDNQNKGEKK